MSERVLRVGVMGAADIAKRHMLPALASLPQLFRIQAIASRERAKAETLALPYTSEAVEGYERLLERADIDVVYMPLPTGLNAEWIPRALRAGKHVLAEKSLAPDYTTARAAVELARAQQLLLMEDFMFVHHAQQVRARELVQSGAIGEVRLLRATFCFPPLKPDNFRYDPALAGGALMDAGGYVAKAAQLYLGQSDPTRIRVLASELHYSSPGKADTRGAALLSDGSISAQLAFGFEHFYQGGYELVGTMGKLTLERAFTSPPGVQAKILLEQPGRRTEELMPADNHFVGILREFHRAVVAEDFEPHYLAVGEQARVLDDIRRLAGSLK